MSADPAASGAADAADEFGLGAPRTPSPRRGDGPPTGSPSGAASTPGGTSVSSATPRADLLESIERLKKEQKDLKAQKKRVTTDLKNAERKRKRLRLRARQLSDSDLVEVIQMRQAASSSTDPTPKSSTKVAKTKKGASDRVRDPDRGGASTDSDNEP